MNFNIMTLIIIIAIIVGGLWALNHFGLVKL
jgi:hypothetical protein